MSGRESCLVGAVSTLTKGSTAGLATAAEKEGRVPSKRLFRPRGLRWEILGNLLVVSAFALLLTGVGVCFIHGDQMLEQSLPLEQVYAGSNRMARFLVLYAGAGMAVLLVCGTILVSRTTVRPLEKMVEVVQAVAEGDLDRRVPFSGTNEMGQLAQAFNRMADRLKAQQKTLNEHVKALQKMNRQLKQSQQEVIQSEKLASVGLLAAGLAHEIGNPLSAILGYVGILQQGVEDHQERDEYLRRVEKEIYRIHRIVMDLQEYSRPVPREVRLVDLGKIVRDTVRLVSAQRDFREIVFDLHLAHGLPPVKADAGQLQQVFVNLFLNARDALDGRGRIRISCQRTRFAFPPGAAGPLPPRRKDDPEGLDFRFLRREDPTRGFPFLEGQELVEVEVADEGAGIAPEHLPRVFDPFFTTKEVGKGTGLGLSVSQRIVESFHGDIRIESRLGQGTTVRLRLPAHESDSGEEAPQDGEKHSDC